MDIIKKLGLKNKIKRDHRLHIRFNRELLEKLTEVSRIEKIPRVTLIEALIVQFLKKYEKGGHYDAESNEVFESDTTRNTQDDTTEVQDTGSSKHDTD